MCSGFLCGGEKCTNADFATGLSWSRRFAVLTNRKLLGLNVFHSYIIYNTNGPFVAHEIS